MKNQHGFDDKVTMLAKRAMLTVRTPVQDLDIDAAEHFTSEEYLNTLKTDVPVGMRRSLYSFERSRLAERLLPDVCRAFPEYDPVVSGHFYYPPGGYMSWHTNSDQPYKRVYVTFADKPGKSFFRYKHGGEIVTEWDKEGVNIRVFEATDKEPLFWHCVFSDCNRVSFGFRLIPR